MPVLHFRGGRAQREVAPGDRQSDAVDRGPVPRTAMRLALYHQLVADGQWSAFETALDANPAEKIEWDLAVEIRRDGALTSTFDQVGLDAAGLDRLFREAAKQ